MKRDIGTPVPSRKNPRQTQLPGECVTYKKPLDEVNAYFEKNGVKPYPAHDVHNKYNWKVK